MTYITDNQALTPPPGKYLNRRARQERQRACEFFSQGILRMRFSASFAV